MPDLPFRQAMTATRGGIGVEASVTARGAILERSGAEQPYAVSRPISVQEVAIDAPGPTEVLLRIEAAGVCHSDLSWSTVLDLGHCRCFSGTRRPAASWSQSVRMRRRT